MIGELFVVPLLGGLDKPNLKKKTKQNSTYIKRVKFLLLLKSFSSTK